MKIKFFKLISLLFLQICFSQVNKVEYSIKMDIENKFNKPLKNFGILYFDNKESLYKEYSGGDVLNIDVKTKDSVSSIKFFNAIDTFYLYKNFESKKAISLMMLFIKKKYVEDSLNLFDWKITDETAKVLDYDCNIATTFFRGRNYKAYFYKNKKHQNGPLKFGGLPGLILKIEVTDSDCIYTMEATKVVLNFKEKYNIVNPYKDEKTMTFDEFKKKNQEKVDALRSFYAQKGDEIIFSNGALEKTLDE